MHYNFAINSNNILRIMSEMLFMVSIFLLPFSSTFSAIDPLLLRYGI